MGRFIAEDPIGLAGGENGEGYVDKNPASLQDPSGEFSPQLVAAGIGAGLPEPASMPAERLLHMLPQ